MFGLETNLILLNETVVIKEKGAQLQVESRSMELQGYRSFLFAMGQRSDSSGSSCGAAKATTQFGYTEVHAWTTSRWRAYSPRWNLLDMCRICVRFKLHCNWAVLGVG